MNKWDRLGKTPCQSARPKVAHTQENMHGSEVLPENVSSADPTGRPKIKPNRSKLNFLNKTDRHY